MHKKSIIITLVALLVLSSIPFNFAATNVYFNSTPSSWAINDINLLASYEILRQEAFSDYDDQVTRLDFIYLAVKVYEELKGTEIIVDPKISFPDTNDVYALKGATVGITSGMGNGNFGPNVLLSREQMATMFVKALELSGVNLSTSTSKFSDDSKISDYAKHSIYKAYNYGLIKGSNDAVNPKGYATNEQVLLIFKNIYDKFSLPAQAQKLTSEQMGALSDSVVKIYVTLEDGSQATGSGFFYESGKIGTNFHVIEGAKAIEIEFEDGTIYKDVVKVIGYDRALDLAALSITKKDVAPLKLGNSDKVVKGQKVYAIGSPIGMINTLSSGIVSSIRANEIQIDAAISRGSSGGVLLDESGSVIGVTYAGIEEGENLGFAIPVNLFRNLPKTQNLTLSAFVSSSALKAEIPTGFTAKFDGKSSVLLYWDDMLADYYIVYESVEGGEFLPLEDADGYNYWFWDADYCLEITEQKAGAKVEYAVASVMGEVVSDFVYSKPFVIPSTPETTALAEASKKLNSIITVLNSTYKTHTINGKTLTFDDFSVDYNEDGSINIFAYMDSTNLVKYLDSEEVNFTAHKNAIFQRNLKLSQLAGMPVKLYYVYIDYYEDYPEPLDLNSIYEESVSWDSETESWFVFYPACYTITDDSIFYSYDGEF